MLAALDGSETVVPNEMLIAGAVQNFSLPSRRVRIATQLTVAYDTDIDRLLPALRHLYAELDAKAVELATRLAEGVYVIAHDDAPAGGRGTLVVVGGGAVVADVRVGEGDDLAGVAGVGEDLLVAGHGGVEDHLSEGRPGGAVRLAVEGAVA